MALLDHLGTERVAIVGNSFGGKVAVEVALAAPERVAALALAAPALAGVEPSAELNAFDEAEDELLEAGKLEEAVELNLRTWLGDTDPELRRSVGEMQRNAFEVVLAAFEKEPPPGPAEWLEPPAAEQLGSLDVPTLVVVGDADLVDFLEIARRLAAEAPRARMAMLEGVKHLAGLERPDEFNELVLGFLAGVFPGDAHG